MSSRGLEDRAERHRDDGVLAHHRLVDALVREHVLARRVEHLERRVGDDRREVLVVDRVDVRRLGADADRAEAQRLGRLDDAVDVLAAAGAARRGRRRLRATRRGARRSAARSPAPRAARLRSAAAPRRLALAGLAASRRGAALLRGVLRPLRRGCGARPALARASCVLACLPLLRLFSPSTRGRRASAGSPSTRSSGRHGLVTNASQPAFFAPSEMPGQRVAGQRHDRDVGACARRPSAGASPPSRPSPAATGPSG